MDILKKGRLIMNKIWLMVDSLHLSIDILGIKVNISFYGC